MRVKCVRFIDTVYGSEIPSVGALTKGKGYNVLEIDVSPGKTALFRVLDDDECPALYLASCFETISEQIPSSWIVRILDAGTLSFGPRSWFLAGFWERYLERDPEMEAIYQREKNLILEEDSG